MKELDLHGLYYHEVELEVINFVFLNSTNLPVRIITGKSTPMSEMVGDVLKKNGFYFEIPSHNSGEIIVFY